MTPQDYHIIHGDDAFPPPDPAAKIWRFMSVAKLVSLLSKQALFFTRADKLDDHYEGSLPKAVVKKAEEGFEKLTPLGQGTIRSTRQHHGYLQSKLWTMVNCWYLNEHESAAMWKVHANEGVSVQSTFQRFIDAIVPSGTIYLGLVRYLNYETEGWDIKNDARTILSIFYKRKSFEHEHEFRAAISVPLPDGIYNCAEGPGYLDANRNPGMYVQVDTARLIEKICVSPGAPSWLQDVVETIARNAKLDGAVVSSQLDSEALW